MENYKGKVIEIYDGALEQWTTAKLLQCIGEVNGKERWKMITKEGYIVVRSI